MGFIYSYAETLLLCLKNNLISLNIINGKCNVVKIPVINLQKTSLQDRTEENSCSSLLTSVCHSQDCSMLAVCTKDKQLIVYKDNFNIVYQCSLARIASKAIFAENSSSILVADKTGDVYQYSLKNNNKGQLILGHLSMLLDIVLTDNEKYVITCDRDEKIRVSCFPNSYNIVSYCLGHKEFITSIKLINDNILVSASGDGTVRFWDFIKGKQLYILDCNESLTDKNIISMFVNKMDLDNVDICALPITEMHLGKCKGYIHLAVCLQCVNSVQIYNIKLGNEISTELVQVLLVENSIISFCFVKMELFILSKNEVNYYKFDSSVGKYNKHESDVLKKFSSNNIHLLQSSVSNDISVLYKRKYDNVQEYQERKKLRLERKNH